MEPGKAARGYFRGVAVLDSGSGHGDEEKGGTWNVSWTGLL